jgi:acetyl-CoA carboxylase biotin carboxyl carrier protein
MISELDNLNEAEIAKIGTLVKMLDKSGFDFLTLEVGAFRLTVGTGNAAPLPASQPAPVQAQARSSSEPAGALPASKPASATAAPSASAAREAAAEGLLDITATTMGTFYARPAPDAEPFVAVGSRVDPESTVGLIEVMKLFNGVTAGVAGTVEEICVEDAQFVEYGQVLVRVRPDA